MWGVCVYGLEPGGILTLEIHTPDGATHEFRGMTLAECFAKAFPPPEPPARVPAPANDVFA